MGGSWGVPEGFETSVVPLVETIDQITEQVLAIEEEIEKATAEEAPTLRRLMGIPGIGRLTASAFMALVEDPSRFRRTSEIAAYLGLAPWVSESAGKRREAGITKRGNRATRSLLIQAAWAHVRSRKDSALKRWFHRLAGRVGRKKAITAVARKLGELMWTMWRKGTSYTAFPPSSRRSAVPT